MISIGFVPRSPILVFRLPLRESSHLLGFVRIVLDFLRRVGGLPGRRGFQFVYASSVLDLGFSLVVQVETLGLELTGEEAQAVVVGGAFGLGLVGRESWRVSSWGMLRAGGCCSAPAACSSCKRGQVSDLPSRELA